MLAGSLRDRFVIALVCLLAPLAASTQEAEGPMPADVLIEPGEVVLEVGEPLELAARVVDADGEELDLPVLFFSASRRDLLVTQGGRIEARRHGSFEVIVIVPNREQDGVLLQRQAEDEGEEGNEVGGWFHGKEGGAASVAQPRRDRQSHCPGKAMRCWRDSGQRAASSPRCSRRMRLISAMVAGCA